MGARQRFRSNTLEVDEVRMRGRLVALKDDVDNCKVETHWSWDGSHYGKTKGGPDRDALALSWPMLQIIAAESTNGYPCCRAVRSVMISVDGECNVLESKATYGQFTAAQKAADNWRKALADGWALKRGPVAKMWQTKT